VTLTRVGSYYMEEEELGQGWLCTVHEAWKPVQLKTGTWGRKYVAIKRYRDNVSPNQPTWESLRDEATIGTAVDHPNLLRVQEVIETDRGPHLVMELLDGVTLDRLTTDGRHLVPLMPPLALEIIYQVALGLHSLHTLEIDGKPVFPVHRDVKPHNAFLTRDGRVVLFDYGICHFTGMKLQDLPNQVYGSCHYMSPEQALGLVDITHMTDQYGLATMLYQLIAGRYAYEGCAQNILYDVVNPEKSPPLDLIEQRCPQVVPILRRCWQNNPKMRYPNMRWLARALWQARRTYQSINNLAVVRPALTGWTLPSSTPTRRVATAPMPTAHE